MAKRANGEGSIYQRRDGRWAASVSVGKGARKHFLGHTRGEVAAQLTEALKKQNDGLPVKFETKRFDVFITEWLANRRRRCSRGPGRATSSLRVATPFLR